MISPVTRGFVDEVIVGKIMEDFRGYAVTDLLVRRISVADQQEALLIVEALNTIFQGSTFVIVSTPGIGLDSQNVLLVRHGEHVNSALIPRIIHFHAHYIDYWNGEITKNRGGVITPSGHEENSHYKSLLDKASHKF